MENKLCFVQFIHPGGEHYPDNARFKSWNTESHERKFMKNKGKYLSEGSICEGDIMFWGEWEPESKVIKFINGPVIDRPNYIYEPYYETPPSYEGLQNTDPFVFGKQFHYTGCRQNTKKGSTQLRNLDVGSVVLFGSCIRKKHFVLDALFVVSHWIDHNKYNYKDVLKNEISDVYTDVVIKPWYQASALGCGPKKIGVEESYRLYYGATYHNKISGMFSFFPCLPFHKELKGFARPEIAIPNIITNNLSQGKRLNPQANLDQVKKLWTEVTKQVVDHGLKLGIYAELPEKKNMVNSIFDKKSEN